MFLQNTGFISTFCETRLIIWQNVLSLFVWLDCSDSRQRLQAVGHRAAVLPEDHDALGNHPPGGVQRLFEKVRQQTFLTLWWSWNRWIHDTTWFLTHLIALYWLASICNLYSNLFAGLCQAQRRASMNSASKKRVPARHDEAQGRIRHVEPGSRSRGFTCGRWCLSHFTKISVISLHWVYPCGLLRRACVFTFSSLALNWILGSWVTCFLFFVFF